MNSQIYPLWTIVKVSLFALLFFCIAPLALAESKLAIIRVKDGVANVHSGAGKSCDVLTTVEKGDFFYCDSMAPQWVKVTTYKWVKGTQVSGYMRKSSVQLVENLKDEVKRKLILEIFIKQQQLADSFVSACRSKDSLRHRTAIRELEEYTDRKYSPVLEIFSGYFCKTKDTKLMMQFFATLWADNGSANEEPSFAMGRCFICHPALVLDIIKKIKNKDERLMIYDEIYFGLAIHFDESLDEKPTNKDYLRFKKMLDKAE